MSGPDRQTTSATRSRVWAALKTEIFRIPPRKRWLEVIHSADLPGAVGGRVREIVRRTRLWRRERVEVARELIAHARDALDAGVAADAVADSLGDPRVVAKLIRRAMKRKRHWLWHARVWVVRTLAGTIGLALLAAGFLVGRFYFSKPNPRHNYYAELNAPILALDEDEKAWPLYKEAYREIQAVVVPARERMQRRAAERESTNAGPVEPVMAGVDLIPTIGPDHPDYDGVVEVLEQIRPALDLVRRGSERKAVGRLFSSKSEAHPGGAESRRNTDPGWLPEPIPEPDDVSEQSLLFYGLLPHLSSMRLFSRWLAFDTMVAARTGDAERAVDSIGTIRGMSRQIECEPFLISYFVAVAVDSLAAVTVERMIEEHAEIFSREDLTSLAHELSTAREPMPVSVLDGERMSFEDFLQRVFTDNGHGDGHLTYEGLWLYGSMVEIGSNPVDLGETPGFMDVPQNAASLATVSRRELSKAYREYLNLVRSDLDAGYEVYRGRGLASERWIESKKNNRSLDPMLQLIPSLNRTIDSQNRFLVHADAALAVIALELCRRDAGAWAESLDVLVPRYLPSAPEDPFTGGPLRLKITGDGPVIYSVGPDGDDDGGVRGEVTRGNVFRQEEDPPDGDWVLYPPKDSRL